GTAFNLTTAGSIAQATNGFTAVSSPTVSLTSTGGDIGSLANNIFTAASTLNLSAASGSVFVTNSGSNVLINTAAANLVTGTFSVKNSANVTNNVAIDAGTILLQAGGAAGNVNLLFGLGDTTNTASVTLAAAGTGAINLNGNTVSVASGATVSLSSGSGAL